MCNRVSDRINGTGGRWAAGLAAGLLLATVGAGVAHAGGPPVNPGGPVRSAMLRPGLVPNGLDVWVIRAAATCPQLSAPLLAAQIEQESQWNPRAVSPIGAQGVSQFLPETWAQFGGDANGDGRSDPFDPTDAILAQGRYMCEMHRQVAAVPGDRATVALWAYNAGPEATKASGGRVPTAEADNYARRILTELLPKYTADPPAQPARRLPPPRLRS